MSKAVRIRLHPAGCRIRPLPFGEGSSRAGIDGMFARARDAVASSPSTRVRAFLRCAISRPTAHVLNGLPEIVRHHGSAVHERQVQDGIWPPYLRD
jgi:hypothetical protein